MKAGGSTSLGRDSESKRLGVKVYAGQPVSAGQVIVRQRGSHYHVGDGARLGGDDTIYARVSGVVKFIKRKRKAFTGKLRQATIVSVQPGK